jgi:hypothetical protein
MTALEPANGAVKNATFGANAVHFCKLQQHAELTPWEEDRVGRIKTAYLDDSPDPEPHCL